MKKYLLFILLFCGLFADGQVRIKSETTDFFSVKIGNSPKGYFRKCDYEIREFTGRALVIARIPTGDLVTPKSTTLPFYVEGVNYGNTDSLYVHLSTVLTCATGELDSATVDTILVFDPDTIVVYRGQGYWFQYLTRLLAPRRNHNIFWARGDTLYANNKSTLITSTASTQFGMYLSGRNTSGIGSYFHGTTSGTNSGAHLHGTNTQTGVSAESRFGLKVEGVSIRSTGLYQIGTSTNRWGMAIEGTTSDTTDTYYGLKLQGTGGANSKGDILISPTTGRLNVSNLINDNSVHRLLAIDANGNIYTRGDTSISSASSYSNGIRNNAGVIEQGGEILSSGVDIQTYSNSWGVANGTDVKLTNEVLGASKTVGLLGLMDDILMGNTLAKDTVDNTVKSRIGMFNFATGANESMGIEYYGADSSVHTNIAYKEDVTDMEYFELKFFDGNSGMTIHPYDDGGLTWKKSTLFDVEDTSGNVFFAFKTDGTIQTPNIATDNVAQEFYVRTAGNDMAVRSASSLLANPDITLTDGATVTWDFSTGVNAKVTLGGNRTLEITNPISGTKGRLRVIQDGTGSRTLILPAGSKVIDGGAGAVTLTTTAGASDILTFYYDGTNFWWDIGKNYN